MNRERELGRRQNTRCHLRAAVFRAVRFLESRLDDPPGVDELARSAGLSKSHFHLAFKRVVGETVQKHVLRLRLELAASYLSHSTWHAGEVALLCGFKTQASFGREFKRMYGKTPRQFRNEAGCVPFMRGKVRSHRSRELSDPEIPVPTVHLEEWPDLWAICLRHYGEIESLSQAWQELLSWAKSILPNPEQARYFGLWFDDWSKGSDDSYRYECAIVPASPLPETLPAPFFFREIPSGQVAVSLARGSLHQLEERWRCFGHGWLPFSGLQVRGAYAIDEYEASLLIAPRVKQMARLATGITLRMCIPVQKEPLDL